MTDGRRGVYGEDLGEIWQHYNDYALKVQQVRTHNNSITEDPQCLPFTCWVVCWKYFGEKFSCSKGIYLYCLYNKCVCDYSAMPLQRYQFFLNFPKYQHWTLHSSPDRARYTVSFVSSRSDLCCDTVDVGLYVISCYTKTPYSSTQLYMKPHRSIDMPIPHTLITPPMNASCC